MSLVLPQPLIGADPEIFIYNNNLNHCVSMHEHFTGSKFNPEVTPYGGLQVDGFALEFNIKPARGLFDFMQGINAGLKDIKERVYKIDKNLFPIFESFVEFPKAYYDTIPEHVKELGCDPDYNAEAKGRINKRPEGSAKLFRTAGGHLHIGWLTETGYMIDPTEQAHMDDLLRS